MNRIINAIIIVCYVYIPQLLSGCAVCYGASDDVMTSGMNNAIMFLLCTIGIVLIGIIAVIFQFYKRSKLINN